LNINNRPTNTALQIQNIISENSNNTAFVLGNGINRFYSKENLSWEKLLLNLWNTYTERKVRQTEIFKGISFTEFYDAIDIQNTKKDNFSSTLQKEVKNKMELWKPNYEQNKIIDKIRSLDSPILTTNFDDLIPKSSSLNFYKMESKGFTDFYPWSCYYSDRELKNPVDGFGVWFPNGMINYHRSIKLGLSQYMGNVERVRKMLHNNKENIYFDGKNRNNWSGYLSWLHIVFNKSLFIVGFGLEENEVFFRWLLIERAKYFKLFPHRRKKGWFITVKDETDLNFFGKKFFLESVGLKVLEVDSYDVLFDKIWE
jgi:hypothetical protein